MKPGADPGGMKPGTGISTRILGSSPSDELLESLSAGRPRKIRTS